MPINKSLPSNVAALTVKAEECMKTEKWAEAFFHWTHAIKLYPEEANFYDQRSKCFTLTQQYSMALEDADVLIGKGGPHGVQGHLRKAQVYHETHNYQEAVKAYQTCFQLTTDSTEKQNFYELASKCKKEWAKQKTLDLQYPYVGAAVGILIAAGVVVFDFLIHGAASYIAHPLLKVLVVVAVSGSCYGVAVLMRDAMV